MRTVIPVKFQYAQRDLWFDPVDTEAVAGDHVICSTERGTEIGLATMNPFEVPEEELDEKGAGVLKPVLRVATDEDLDRAAELAEKGEQVFPAYRALVKESGLDIKPVGVEYLFGGEKVVCYFAAEERVDFRQLVRDLSRELHERIDMRQIGVREEAALVGGYAHCGQELCCARFGRQFEPVSIRMAKEQDLPLNSTKISGACGRLMCCLRYEFEAYRDFKGRAPKKNAVIETPLGKAKIIEYDTPKEQLALRLESGKVVRVPLAEMEASEAAHKKSEELGCPCRPDTVTRATLERLNSPEVQMALAELDREMGILPEETFDQSDIFVEPARKRRRKSHDAAAESAPEAPAESAPSPDATPAKKRRRRSRGDKQQAAPAPVVPEAQPEAAPEQTPSRRRRRHKAAGEGTGKAPQAETALKREEHAEGEGKARKRTRRPGDKGGQKAAQAQAKHLAQPAEKSGREGAAASADAPKAKRRRHRGGRGRGKGGSGEGGAPTEG